MIVHVYPYEKYTTQFVNFINDNYDINEHFFIIHGNVPSIELHIKNESNVAYIEGSHKIVSNEKLTQMILNCDKIIAHTMYCPMEWLAKYPNLIKKTYIFFWGADIYNVPYNVHGFFGIIREAKRVKQICNAAGIITQMQGDYEALSEYIEKRGKIKGKHFNAMYPFDTVRLEKQLKVRNTDKSDAPVKIILGNSASKTNGHAEMLQKLKRYKDENILIYCPLSYGDMEYGKEIAQMGKDLLGEKFVALTDYMSETEYWNLLNECRIGIFNISRQQALANINILSLYGAKIYMKNKNASWDYFVGENGFMFYDINEVGNVDFSEFINLSSDMQKTNYDKVMYYNTALGCKPQWDKIFGD